MKTCTKCNTSKQLDAFGKLAKSPDGHCWECKICHNAFQRLRNVSEREKQKLYSKKYRQNNSQSVKETKRFYNIKNRERVAKTKRNLYLRDRERIRNNQKEYARKNTGLINKISARRHAAKLKRTPKWLTAKDWFEIEKFYIKAAEMTKETGIQHDVDHIIPLQGKTVSGLHTPQNLQILTQEQNCRKGNRF